MNVLLSIKQKWVRRILVGAKKLEFRKSFPDNVDKIFLYVSYPQKKIIGYITTDCVYKSTIKDLKEFCLKHYPDFDSEEEGFDDYFRIKPEGVVIRIDDVFVFDVPINPYELDGFKPPQSYYIVNKELEEFILGKISG